MGLTSLVLASLLAANNPNELPPGNAMNLSVGRARMQLRETLRKQYAGPFRYCVMAFCSTGNAELPSQVTVTRNGFQVVASYTANGKPGIVNFTVTYASARAYVATDRDKHFKTPAQYFSVGYLPSPDKNQLEANGLGWNDEAIAQQFANAFNRLVYAARNGNTEDRKDFEEFQTAAKAWRESPTKPPLSEAADRERILAENAINEKNMQSAVDHYDAGLEADPMWPQGWYNAALIYGQLQQYDDASEHMKHYLELAPDAPDAKAAREQMIIWEDKAKQGAK
jgi:tetratricopeptide (TPR) repeat protein